MTAPQSPGTKPVVAVFDFDGTLTYADSFVPFLREVGGRATFVITLLLLAPALMAGLLGAISRKRLKEHLIHRFLRGRTIDELQRISIRFCEGRLLSLMNPAALRQLRWHQKQGHPVILLSASPETYLKVWAARNGVPEVLATRIQISGDTVSGVIDGENCRGPEKVIRLEAHLGQLGQFVIFAYGDSRADLDLLHRVTNPFYRSFAPDKPFHRWFLPTRKFIQALA